MSNKKETVDVTLANEDDKNLKHTTKQIQIIQLPTHYCIIAKLSPSPSLTKLG
jgi:hypothetical protein